MSDEIDLDAITNGASRRETTITDDSRSRVVTDEQLQALVRHVAMASYRAARYRGQMNAESLEPIQRKMVSRKADEWFEQNKDEYV